ncbi:DNA methyltransferase [Runella sp.]|uniref:DNA methyltransferase n=1 Tax=Runella sp. TaxID=1960881 RepID=UPI0030158E4D
MTIEELHAQIDQLKAQNYQLSQQNERLAFQLKRAAEEGRFGLHWLDVPEDFGPEADNAIPILKEVKSHSFHTPDGKPTHVLIEGENYHALQCLSYTHEGKIDVIYIDPPYNTGSDGFTYRDKRLLKEYPDGTPVPKESPLRHSYWLAFMHKRLQLAHKLLSDKGVIFISIDDNEVAQLKLLCDEVFGEENTVGFFTRIRKKKGSNLSKKFRKITEYVLGYKKEGSATIELYGSKSYSDKQVPLLNRANNPSILEFLPNQVLVGRKLTDGIFSKGHFGEGELVVELLNDIKIENKVIVTPFRIRGRFRWSQKTVENELKNGSIFIASDTFRVNVSRYNQDEKFKAPSSLITPDEGMGTNEDATEELREVFPESAESLFDFPKPVSLISYLVNSVTQNRINSTILDFFAGSGTTLHATMALNAEDGGQRQCILVTNNENNICEEVCYERNRRVMQGYTNAKGQAVAPLGNSLNYYRVGFVGKNHAHRANDEDLLTLAHHAGELLALAENTLYELESAEYYQIFCNYPTDFDPASPPPMTQPESLTLDFGEAPAERVLAPRRYTGIYFQEDLGAFDTFRALIQEYSQETSVYVFSWSEGEFDDYFEEHPNVRVKSIPEPILKIYRSINQN